MERSNELVSHVFRVCSRKLSRNTGHIAYMWPKYVHECRVLQLFGGVCECLGIEDKGNPFDLRSLLLRCSEFWALSTLRSDTKIHYRRSKLCGSSCCRRSSFHSGIGAIKTLKGPSQSQSQSAVCYLKIQATYTSSQPSIHLSDPLRYK